MKDFPYPETVVFVRHAQSKGNLLSPAERAALPVGTTSYDLTPFGERQADITGEYVRKHFPNPDRLIRSYYRRTRLTGERCYPGWDIREDERLAEANRGVYTVLGEDGVRVHMPWELERRERDGLYHYMPPGGENWPMIEARIRSFRRSLRMHYSGKTVVCFTHGFWLLLWQKRVHRWTIEETERRYREDEIVANASVLIYRGRWDDERGKHVLAHDPATDYVVPWEGKIAA